MLKSAANRLRNLYKLPPVLVFLVTLTFGVTVLFLVSEYENRFLIGSGDLRSNAFYLSSSSFSYLFVGFKNLVMVVGHSIYTTRNCGNVDEEDFWFLELYLKHKGQAASFVGHIKEGTKIAARDDGALLLISWGKTRKDAGPRSKAHSYWAVVDSKHWSGKKEGVRWRTPMEEHVRDSFENLLFSVCRFKELTGIYPDNITVVSYFTEERFGSSTDLLLGFLTQGSYTQGHSRVVETTRSISNITVNFFKTLDLHFSKLSYIVEEVQTVHDKKLSDLENKYEVQTAVDDLRESFTSRTSKLQQEVSSMQNFTHTVKGEWNIYIEKTETHYIEDTASVESGKRALEEALQHWNGMEANHVVRAQLSSATRSSLDDLDVANRNLLCSIEEQEIVKPVACGMEEKPAVSVSTLAEAEKSSLKRKRYLEEGSHQTNPHAVAKMKELEQKYCRIARTNSQQLEDECLKHTFTVCGQKLLLDIVFELSKTAELVLLFCLYWQLSTLPKGARQCLDKRSQEFDALTSKFEAQSARVKELKADLLLERERERRRRDADATAVVEK
ncbi:hypothetical protein GIB67_001714 [Kingdonia uniflora]|uniref:Uncharacterized protein n=1 Tax=Kingdonia uniflora TaxID=39325 RepID=A0A7J7LN19_9MAGN|nr:hypothetical protein GIB67_001714 [Kingdonia uniflora]